MDILFCNILSTLSLIFPVHWDLVKALPRIAPIWGLAFGEHCKIVSSSSVVQWLYSTWKNYVGREGNGAQWDGTALEEGGENYNIEAHVCYQLLGFMDCLWFFFLHTHYFLPCIYHCCPFFFLTPSQFLFFCSSVPKPSLLRGMEELTGN